MKSRLFLIVLILLCFSLLQSIAQKPISVPVHAGDILVYQYDNHFGVVAFKTFRTSIDTSLIECTEWGPPNGICPGKVRINTRNMFSIFSEDMNSLIAWYDCFPAFIPQEDSIQLYSEIESGQVEKDLTAIIQRRFDTTIFNQRVAAYSMVYKLDNKNVYTVTDIFGLVKMICSSEPSLSYELSSATISGVRYNWDERRWTMMPLCVGNMYQYGQYRGSGLMYDTLELFITAKSILNGKSKYSFVTNKFSSGTLYEDSLGVMINDANGERVFCPWNAVPGAQVNYQYIIDTSTVFLYGRSRRKIIARRITTFGCYLASSSSEVWIEGIGKVISFKANDYRVDYDTLKYAKICDETFDFITSVDQTLNTPDQIYLSQNSPNPFAISTNISYKIASTTHVRVRCLRSSRSQSRNTCRRSC